MWSFGARYMGGDSWHGMAGLWLRDVFGRYALIELHRMESCSTILGYASASLLVIWPVVIVTSILLLCRYEKDYPGSTLLICNLDQIN